MNSETTTTDRFPTDDEVADNVWGVPGISIADWWRVQEPDLIEDSIARSLRYLGVHIPDELIAREV